MISVVIPTRNRAYTLEKVLPSYFQQKRVAEVVIIDDAGSDHTEAVVKKVGKKFPTVTTIYQKNKKAQGSSFGKNIGAELAKHPWVLIGEDDAFLASNYTEALLQKFEEIPDLGIASGRMIDLLPGEDPMAAIFRFGNGNPQKKIPFNFPKFSHVPDACYEGDVFLPVTHAMILTKKKYLQAFPYDTWYARGNGYREESDFQVQLFVHGKKILASNSTHAMHMNRKDVPTGGHRVSVFERFICNLRHTCYFYQKYYKSLAKKLPLPKFQSVALFKFACAEIGEIAGAIPTALRKRIFR